MPQDTLDLGTRVAITAISAKKQIKENIFFQYIKIKNTLLIMIGLTLEIFLVKMILLIITVVLSH